MSEPSSKALVADLDAQRDRIMDAMLAMTVASPGVTESEGRQFVAGYFDIVRQAANGDLTARDTYLETIIPGLKASGMTLGYLLGTTAGVAMGIASIVAREHLVWHAAFTREYIAHFTLLWDQA